MTHDRPTVLLCPVTDHRRWPIIRSDDFTWLSSKDSALVSVQILRIIAICLANAFLDLPLIHISLFILYSSLVSPSTPLFHPSLHPSFQKSKILRSLYPPLHPSIGVVCLHVTLRPPLSLPLPLRPMLYAFAGSKNYLILKQWILFWRPYTAIKDWTKEH